jgi:hypothetical protein
VLHEKTESQTLDYKQKPAFIRLLYLGKKLLLSPTCAATAATVEPPSSLPLPTSVPVNLSTRPIESNKTEDKVIRLIDRVKRSSSQTADLMQDDAGAAAAAPNTQSTKKTGFQMNILSILLSIFLSMLILTTVIGNVFVIIAIVRERTLRTFGNYLVFSLAIADLMVALLVMPIGAIYEVTGEWMFGPQLCDLWTCMDVLSCTASILHLVAIALDRFWAVTNVDYITSRTSRSISLLIGSVWTMSIIISAGPILGWKDANFLKRITDEKKCIISQDVLYQILATCSTFYGPLIVILILYWKIFKVRGISSFSFKLEVLLQLNQDSDGMRSRKTKCRVRR